MKNKLLTDAGVGKWNYHSKQYLPYELPEFASLYETDLTTVVQCAQCSEPTMFGSSYTSRQIHNGVGMGYMVCPSCYTRERARQHAYTTRKRALV